MSLLPSIIKGVGVFAMWEIVVRYAPNHCFTFAAFPVLLTVCILRGHRAPPPITYKNSNLSLVINFFWEILVVELYLSSHPPPQVRKRLGVSGVHNAQFSFE